MKKLFYAITAFIALVAISAIAMPNKAHAAKAEWFQFHGNEFDDTGYQVYLGDKVVITSGKDYEIKITVNDVVIQNIDEDVELKNINYRIIYKSSNLDYDKGYAIHPKDKVDISTNGKSDLSTKVNDAVIDEIDEGVLLIDGVAVSGEKTIFNNVDTPYNLDQIKKVAKIKVIDAYDGDITHLMTVKHDNYTANKKILGQSSVTYTVTNSGGLTTEYVQPIMTFDSTAPSVLGDSSTRLSYTKEITAEEIASKYVVTDNYDANVKLELVSSDYVINKVGKYSFVFKAVDSSKNETRVTHTLNVIDDVAPNLVSSLSDFKITFKQKITDTLLLSGLNANDEVDGDLTGNIKVESHNVQAGKLGKYTVVYSVSDKAGNKTTLERQLEIITLDYPVYYISSDMITIEDVNKLTIDQIAVLYAKLNNIDMDSYTVITNDYENNETTAGMHLLSMSIVDRKGTEHLISKTLNVVELPKDTRNWFEKTWQDSIVPHFENNWIWYAIGGVVVVIIGAAGTIIALTSKPTNGTGITNNQYHKKNKNNNKNNKWH